MVSQEDRTQDSQKTAFALGMKLCGGFSVAASL